MFDWLRELTKSAETRREERTIAYVDGKLSDAESKQFEQEMASDTALRTDVAELRRVKSALREIPRQPVPYNFLLNPADYVKPAPAYGVRAYPILQGATALAALVFIIMATLTLDPFGGTVTQETAAIESMAEPAAAPMADAPAAESLVLEEAVGEEADSATADDAAAVSRALPQAAPAQDSEMADDTMLAESAVVTSTGAADSAFEMASDAAATDDEGMTDNQAGNTADADMAGEAELAEEAPAADDSDAAALPPTITLNPTETPLPALQQEATSYSNVTVTVAITASQAAPGEVAVVTVDEPTVEEIQTVEPAPQASNPLSPTLVGALIAGTLFILLLFLTLWIRRQL